MSEETEETTEDTGPGPAVDGGTLTQDQVLTILDQPVPKVKQAITTITVSEDLQALDILEEAGQARQGVLKVLAKALNKNPPEDKKAHRKAVKTARRSGRDKRHEGEAKCAPWGVIQDGVDALIVDASQRDTLNTGLAKADHVLDQVVGQGGVLDRAMTFGPGPGGLVAEAVSDAALWLFQVSIRGLFRSFVQNRFDALKAEGRV